MTLHINDAVSIDNSTSPCLQGFIVGFHRHLVVVKLTRGMWAHAGSLVSESKEPYSYIRMLIVHPECLTKGWLV